MTGTTAQSPFAGRRVVLAVTGGIAAYKAAEVTSQLVQLGAFVEVILTAGAEEFIRPLTFSALTRQPVHTDAFSPWSPERAGHVTLAATADALLVAPATANTIAHLSLGLADDLLGMVALATSAPLVIAPAMEHHMWHHPATQEHVGRLVKRGGTLVAPVPGRLASGAVGDGRMAAPATIVGTLRQVFGRTGRLAGKRFVITAGGTHESLDPVRFLGNRSSGRMGLALAAAAIDLGAAVTLIVGPISLAPPVGPKVIRVETALEMQAAVLAETETADVLVMAAAVADYRPDSASPNKLKKDTTSAVRDLRLVENPDILASINWPGLMKIGFAAETEDLVEHATAKLTRKGLAMIIANDAVATIGQPASAATLIVAGQAPDRLPEMAKDDLARVIMERVADRLYKSQPVLAPN